MNEVYLIDNFLDMRLWYRLQDELGYVTKDKIPSNVNLIISIKQSILHSIKITNGINRR